MIASSQVICRHSRSKGLLYSVPIGTWVMRQAGAYLLSTRVAWVLQRLQTQVLLDAALFSQALTMCLAAQISERHWPACRNQHVECNSACPQRSNQSMPQSHSDKRILYESKDMRPNSMQLWLGALQTVPWILPQMMPWYISLKGPLGRAGTSQKSTRSLPCTVICEVGFRDQVCCPVVLVVHGPPISCLKGVALLLDHDVFHP